MIKIKSDILRIAGRKIDLNNLNKRITNYLNGIKTEILLKKDNKGNKITVLFVEQQDEKSISLLDMEKELKDAAVIKEIIPLSRFPLDNNGETDKKALEELLDDVHVLTDSDDVSSEDMCFLHVEKFHTAEPIHIKDIIIKNDSSEKTEKIIENTALDAKKAYVYGGEIKDVPFDVNDVPSMLLRAAEKYPEKGIYNIDREGNETFISYPHLLENSKKVLNGLRSKGVKKGEKVILLIDSNEKYYYALWGCFLGGIIPAPMTAPTNFNAKSNDIKVLKSVWETIATVYKGNIIKNLIMDCQSYTKYRPNETMGGIFVSWRRKEELPTGA